MSFTMVYEFDKLKFVVYARVSTARAIDTRRTQNITERAPNERFRSSGRKCSFQNDTKNDTSTTSTTLKKTRPEQEERLKNDTSRLSKNDTSTTLSIRTILSDGAILLPRPGIRSSIQSLPDIPLLASHRLAFKTLCVLLGCRAQPDVNVRAIESWRGYTSALVNYVYNAADELSLRELPNVTGNLLDALLGDAPALEAKRVSIPQDARYASTVELHDSKLLPWWFGWSPVHSSHREALALGGVENLVYPAGKGRAGKVSTLSN